MYTGVPKPTSFPGSVSSASRNPFRTAGRGKRSSLDVNFCKDHRDKTELPDPLAVEDLISCKLNDRQKLARLITQYSDLLCNISEGTAFLLRLQI